MPRAYRQNRYGQAANPAMQDVYAAGAELSRANAAALLDRGEQSRAALAAQTASSQQSLQFQREQATNAHRLGLVDRSIMLRNSGDDAGADALMKEYQGLGPASSTPQADPNAWRSNSLVVGRIAQLRQLGYTQSMAEGIAARDFAGNKLGRPMTQVEKMRAAGMNFGSQEEVNAYARDRASQPRTTSDAGMIQYVEPGGSTITLAPRADMRTAGQQSSFNTQQEIQQQGARLGLEARYPVVDNPALMSYRGQVLQGMSPEEVRLQSFQNIRQQPGLQGPANEQVVGAASLNRYASEMARGQPVQVPNSPLFSDPRLSGPALDPARTRYSMLSPAEMAGQSFIPTTPAERGPLGAPGSVRYAPTDTAGNAPRDMYTGQPISQEAYAAQQQKFAAGLPAIPPPTQEGAGGAEMTQPEGTQAATMSAQDARKYLPKPNVVGVEREDHFAKLAAAAKRDGGEMPEFGSVLMADRGSLDRVRDALLPKWKPIYDAMKSKPTDQLLFQKQLALVYPQLFGDKVVSPGAAAYDSRSWTSTSDTKGNSADAAYRTRDFTDKLNDLRGAFGFRKLPYSFDQNKPQYADDKRTPATRK